MRWIADGRRVTTGDGRHVCDCASEGEGGAELAREIAGSHNALLADPPVLDAYEAVRALGVARADDGARDCMALDRALETTFALADRLAKGGE